MRKAKPLFGMPQKAAGCSDGPTVKTFHTAERIRTAVPLVTTKASQPATNLLRATNRVSTAPAPQVRIEPRTACSGVSIRSLLGFSGETTTPGVRRAFCEPWGLGHHLASATPVALPATRLW